MRALVCSRTVVVFSAIGECGSSVRKSVAQPECLDLADRRTQCKLAMTPCVFAVTRLMGMRIAGNP